MACCRVSALNTEKHDHRAQCPDPFQLERIRLMNRSSEADRETIDRVLAGDFEAFEELVEKYQGRIYRHVRKMVKDNLIAEDLLQETFLNAYRGTAGFFRFGRIFHMAFQDCDQ